MLVTGSELSLFTVGFLPGETFKDRLGLLTQLQRRREVLADVPARVNGFLGKAAAVVRERFGGRISEDEQATYLRELLDIFDAEGVDGAFWYTFARYDLPHRSDPREDLDMASYGVVKALEDRRGRTYPDMPWEPKDAFTALAEHYRG